MAWIDYKKAFNMVMQRWIIGCIKIYKVSDKVIKFIKEIMELTAGGKSLAEVKILSGIFQGDALSSLLFVIAMILLDHILRKYKLHIL